MALLGTKARDEYYRNDSPVGKKDKWLAAVEKPERSPKVGVHILKYCRREEEKKKKFKGTASWMEIYREPAELRGR